MYETHLTVVGTLITTVDRRRLVDGTTKVNFRVACNERRPERSGGGWTDGDKLFLSVSCWRGLAENVHASLVVGDPVILRGRLVTREWEKDGQRRSMTELEASSVGPDLSRCTARITRTRRGAPAAERAADTGPDVLDGGGSGDDLGPAGPIVGAADGFAAIYSASGSDPWQGAGSTGFLPGVRDDGTGDGEWTDDLDEAIPQASVEAAVEV